MHENHSIHAKLFFLFETIGRLLVRNLWIILRTRFVRINTAHENHWYTSNFFFLSKRLKNSSHTNLRILQTNFVCVNNTRKSLMHVKLSFFSKRLENFSSEIYVSFELEGGKEGRRKERIGKWRQSCVSFSLSREFIFAELRSGKRKGTSWRSNAKVRGRSGRVSI